MGRNFKVSGKATLDTSSFTTSINGVAKNVSRVCRESSKDFKSLSKTFNSIGKDSLILGGGLALGLVASFKSLVSSGKELSEVSRQLNISTNSAKQLSFAAQMGGLEFQDMAASISKMQKALGTGKGDDALKSLGLNPATIKKMSSDRAFTTIIESLAKVSDANKRTALSMDLFGKTGFKMLRFVENGKSKLNEFLLVAQQMGVSFSEEKAKRFELFQQRMIQLAAAIKQLGNTILLELEPYITSWYQKLLALTVSVGAFMKEHKTLVSNVAKGVLIFAFLNAALCVTSLMFGRVFSLMSTVAKVTKTLFGWIVKKTAATVADTAATTANTAAIEANSIAKAANAMAGAGGSAAGIGLGTAALAMTGGALVGGYAGKKMYDAGMANEGTSTGWLLGGIGRKVGDWWGSRNAEENLGSRTKELMAQGKLSTQAQSQSTTKDDTQSQLLAATEKQNEYLAKIASNTRTSSGVVKNPSFA